MRLLDDFFNNSHLVELVDAGHDKPVLVHGDLKPTNIFFDDSSMPTFFDIEDMRVIDNRTLGAGYDFGRLFTACSDEHALQRRLWAAWCGPERDTDSVVTAQLGILYWTIHGLSWYVSHAELRHKVAPYMVMLEKTLDGSAGMSVAEFAGSDTVTPSKLIRRVAAVPELRSTYEKDGAERIPLTIHSERVVGLFEKYFADSDMAQKYGRDFFRLFFGLHDAGKPRSIEEARPEMEHQYTTDMIIRSAESLGLRTSHLELMSGLLAGDPVGEYIQGKIPTEVAGKIVRSMAEAGDVPVADMAAMVEMYFMCDAGSYTAAAGGDERLDHLFVFDPSKRKVAFAASIESMMRTLRMQF